MARNVLTTSAHAQELAMVASLSEMGAVSMDDRGHAIAYRNGNTLDVTIAVHVLRDHKLVTPAGRLTALGAQCLAEAAAQRHPSAWRPTLSLRTTARAWLTRHAH